MARSVLRLATTIGAALLVVSALGAGAAAQDTTGDFVGTWEITTRSPVGENKNLIEIRKDGETLKAVAKSDQGPGELPYDAISIDGNKLTLVLTIQYENQPMTITYVGTLIDKSVNGTADFGGLAMGDFSMARPPAKDAPK